MVHYCNFGPRAMLCLNQIHNKNVKNPLLSKEFKGTVKPCDYFLEYIHYGSSKSYVSVLITDGAHLKSINL